MTTNEPRPTPQARLAYRDVCEAMAEHADNPWQPVGYSESEIRQIIADAGSTTARFVEHWTALREDQKHND